MSDEPARSSSPEDAGWETPPPFLGRWSRLYWGVLLVLVGLIALFYWFRRAFE